MKSVFASRNPPFVLSGIPLSGQPGIIQECSTLFVLAPPRSAVSFQYWHLQAIHHHHHFHQLDYLSVPLPGVST